MKDIVETIGDPRSSKASRLEALAAYEGRRLREPPSRGAADEGPAGPDREVNNHIHTIYSFSPYTPAAAALRARDAGLAAAGSVDHDSISAADEMLAACAILGIGGCSGFELRVSFKEDAEGSPGPFADRKINNPDSLGYVYMTIQGVPAPARPAVRSFLAPIQERRNQRNLAMLNRINALLAPVGLRELDFRRDVLERSKASEGGSVTERHLMAATAEAMIEKWGMGEGLVSALGSVFGLTPTAKIAALLSDPANPHYRYDLLGILKSSFLDRVFIQPDGEECVPAKRVVDFARSVGAVPAYAYLGDVGESPTGDKKAEKFEDEFLVELFDELVRYGYRAVAYMPPRNTTAQLARVQQLCAERGLMEISGVDINSSRQSFNCPEVLRPEYRHLVGTTWALIAHERLAAVDPALDLFSPDNPLSDQGVGDRLAAYAAAGRALDPHKPAETAPAVAEELKNGRYQS